MKRQTDRAELLKSVPCLMVMHRPYLLWTESLPSSSVFALRLMECGWRGAGSSATQPKWRVITVKYRPTLCRLILRAVITVQTNRHIGNQGQIHWLTSKIKPPLNATITITVKEWIRVMRRTYTLRIYLKSTTWKGMLLISEKSSTNLFSFCGS